MVMTKGIKEMTKGAKLKVKNTPSPKKKVGVARGQRVLLLTSTERRADMKAFGLEVRKSKASATAFLKKAGILDDSGKLASYLRA